MSVGDRIGRPCSLCSKPTLLVRIASPIRDYGGFTVSLAVARYRAVCDYCDNDALRTLAKAMIENEGDDR